MSAKGFFENISSTFFLKSTVFGFMLLAVLFLINPHYFACGALAALIGFICSERQSTPKILKDSGLITINCFFLGMAMASLFQPSAVFYCSLVLCAIALAPITKACFEVLQHWKLSPLVIPYILATWVLWLASQGSALHPLAFAWPTTLATLPAFHPEWTTASRLGYAVLQSMGRLLFLPDPIFGLSILVLITAFSPRRGAYFLVGTILATVIAYGFSAGGYAWEYGFLSYSGGLIGLGLASSPEKFSFPTISLFCALSAIFTVAADRLLGGLFLPTLSLPYVVTLWLAQLSRVPRVHLSWAPSNQSKQSHPSQVSKLSFPKITSPAPEKVA